MQVKIHWESSGVVFSAPGQILAATQLEFHHKSSMHAFGSKPPGFGAVVNVQSHHFSDASANSCGVVWYLRIVGDKGVPNCSFVLGKSRVIPLKVVSIPRLELGVAVVAVKLNCLIRNKLEYPIHDTIYWTDSTVVLQYIRSESRRFHTFVANRVSECRKCPGRVNVIIRAKMLEPLLSHYSSWDSLLKGRSLVGTFQEVFGWPP